MGGAAAMADFVREEGVTHARVGPLVCFQPRRPHSLSATKGNSRPCLSRRERRTRKSDSLPPITLEKLYSRQRRLTEFSSCALLGQATSENRTPGRCSVGSGQLRLGQVGKVRAKVRGADGKDPLGGTALVPAGSGECLSALAVEIGTPERTASASPSVAVALLSAKRLLLSRSATSARSPRASPFIGPPLCLPGCAH
jgi:hypothetical protein